MGNLLINEENPGDGIPDDASNGDVKRFEIDDEHAYTKDGNGDPFSVQARLNSFAFVDDVNATITIALKNPNNLDDSENVILSSTGTNTSTTGKIAAFGFDVSIENEIYALDIESELATYYSVNSGLYNFDLTDAYLDYWTIDYNSSGGLGEVQFSFLNTSPPPVPEPSTVFGAGALVGLLAFKMLKRRRRSGSAEA